jgi:hypothetical protein
LDVTNKNRRGFTDHEHLNEQQLIHMNGRVSITTSAAL